MLFSLPPLCPQFGAVITELYSRNCHTLKSILHKFFFLSFPSAAIMGNEGGKEEQPNEESGVSGGGTSTQVRQVSDNLETESQQMERLERERERKAKQKAEEDRRKKDLQEKELEKELKERKRREKEEKRKRRQQEQEELERKRQMEEEEKERKLQLEEEAKEDAENRRLADAEKREKIRAAEAEAERLEAERVEAAANKKKKDADVKTKVDDGFLDDLVAMTAEDGKSAKRYVAPKLSAGWQMADKKFDNSRFRRANNVAAKYDDKNQRANYAAPAVAAPLPETAPPAMSPPKKEDFDDDDESMMNDILNGL